MKATSKPSPPRVQLSDLLYDALEAEGVGPDWFADQFADWKALGTAGEYASFYFGKDGAYAEPRRGGCMVLRHAHLPPGDPAALAEWARLHRRRRRRTSDTCVIYTQDARFGYLLLYIAREPTGHAISDMRVPAAARFMSQLADAAEAFMHDGAIVL
ncbi:type II toxin-antitoxin system YafO family toxin [Variovorax saccharolyticus]|uniref:type II toxin-antitoxin system YafO family toxin n=1 Tax=Variovorax saccharolyticus TaxID=3053516 RepID=UPI002575D4AA|nr:type II toxin-antitoxin system YafO family toxin [Variovorax sp. J31P216]MDM0029895.1 type II toxin-antitoxin system YafO family toxin [Variovorax sp. J31P216]